MTIMDMLRAGVATASADETRRLGERLAAALPPDTTLALHGDLGVGKTTFVQGLARGFGLLSRVTSPTFNIIHIYRPAAAPAQSGAGHACAPPAVTLVHLDAYRLEGARELDGLMLDDFLASPYCLAVEWPERIAGWLPEDALHLNLAIESPGRHRLVLR